MDMSLVLSNAKLASHSLQSPQTAETQASLPLIPPGVCSKSLGLESVMPS